MLPLSCSRAGKDSGRGRDFHCRRGSRQRTRRAACNLPTTSRVTAKFNLNLLTRINREPRRRTSTSIHSHFATYNRELARIEMYLESCKAQKVHVLGQAFDFPKPVKRFTYRVESQVHGTVLHRTGPKRRLDHLRYFQR